MSARDAEYTNADGLMVNIKVLGPHPVLGVVALFAHHVALLGPHRPAGTACPSSGRRGSAERAGLDPVAETSPGQRLKASA